jgi:hypothetical protein
MMSGAPPGKYASLPVLEPHEVVKARILDATLTHGTSLLLPVTA